MHTPNLLRVTQSEVPNLLDSCHMKGITEFVTGTGRDFRHQLQPGYQNMVSMIFCLVPGCVCDYYSSLLLRAPGRFISRFPGL